MAAKQLKPKKTIRQQIAYHEEMATINDKKAEEADDRAGKFRSRALAHADAALALRQQVAEATK